MSLGWLAVVASAGRADEIRLRGGGVVQGVAVPDVEKPGYLKIYTTTAGVPLSMKKERVEAISPVETPLTEYVERLKAVSASPEGQLELANWCESNGLGGLAQHHFKETVSLDPNNGPANEKLGKVLWDGAWRTYDEVRKAQGLVLFQGRWMTPEERQRIEDGQRQTDSQKGWTRRITAVLQKYYQGTGEQQIQAEQELRAIQEPSAIVPLVNVLGQEGPELRSLLAEILGRIDDPQAAAGLVHRLLSDADARIRLITFDELAKKKDPQTVQKLMRGLQDPDAERVGRAAAALAALDAKEAVPKLVPVLTSVQRRVETVLVPTKTGGGSGFNVGFGNVQGYDTLPAPGGIVSGGGVAGGGGFIGTVPSFGVLTGPVVAPGVVAFGATAAPFGSGVAMSSGGGGAGVGPTELVPTPMMVPYQHQNAEVLSALERLTGRNFGFDVPQWKRWLRQEFRPPSTGQPDRRVPQP